MGAAGGWAAGAVWLAPLGAVGGSVVPVAGTVAGATIGGLSGCIIGGVLGAVGSGVATASVQDWAQVDCQSNKYDGVSGACIASLSSGFDWNAEYCVSSFCQPIYIWVIGGIVLFFVIILLLKK